MPKKSQPLTSAEDLRNATFQQVPHTCDDPELLARFTKLSKPNKQQFSHILIEAGFEARRDRTSCMFVDVSQPVLGLLAELGFEFTAMLEGDNDHWTGSLSWSMPVSMDQSA